MAAKSKEVIFDGSVIVSVGKEDDARGQFVHFHLTDKKRSIGSDVEPEEKETTLESLSFLFERTESIDAVIEQLIAARKRLRSKDSEMGYNR